MGPTHGAHVRAGPTSGAQDAATWMTRLPALVPLGLTALAVVGLWLTLDRLNPYVGHDEAVCRQGPLLGHGHTRRRLGGAPAPSSCQRQVPSSTPSAAG